MSAKDIRKLLENFNNILQEDALTNHSHAIDLIHDIFKKLNNSLYEDPKGLKIIVLDLIDTLQELTLSGGNSGDMKKTIEFESMKRTLSSIASQLDRVNDDVNGIKYNSIKGALMSFLKKLYQDVISANNDFEKLASTNVEAKQKITDLAKLIYLKTSDNDIKKQSVGIMKQAEKIK